MQGILHAQTVFADISDGICRYFRRPYVMIPPYSTKTCPWINPFTSTQTAHAKATPAQAAGGYLCATAHRRKNCWAAKPKQVVICTDSQYVKNGMESWIHGWKKNGWKTAAKKPVKNDDLWKELDSLVQQHDVRWTWVKGHAGHPENEKADELANRGAAKFL